MNVDREEQTDGASSVSDEAVSDEAVSDEAIQQKNGAPNTAQNAVMAKRKKRKKVKVPLAGAAEPPPPAEGASESVVGRRRILKLIGLLVALGVLLTGVLVLIRALGRPKPPEKWQAGDVFSVEITLVASDVRNLACASTEAIAGRHCAFDTSNKPWSKGGSADDKNILKPYTTTDRVTLLAGGMWSEPALQGTLPTTRFSVKCKYTVEGKLKTPSIRWAPGGPWLEQKNDWNSGLVSDCTLVADGGT